MPQSHEVVQTRLPGVWFRITEGCPHRHGTPEGVDLCEENEMRVCELETGKRCELFDEIIEEWKKEGCNAHQTHAGDGLAESLRQL